MRPSRDIRHSNLRIVVVVGGICAGGIGAQPAHAQTVSGTLKSGASCQNGPEDPLFFTTFGEFLSSNAGLCFMPDMATCSTSEALSAANVFAGSIEHQLFASGQKFFETEVCSAGGFAEAIIEIGALDVVFTNIADPRATGPITYSTNLVLEGFITTDVDAVSNASGTTAVKSIQTTVGTFQIVGVTSDDSGVLKGFPNDGSAFPFILDENTALLQEPEQVKLSMSASVACGFTNAFLPGAVSVQNDMVLHLPIGSPVFNLPPGITANSKALNIVNNIWQGAPGLEGDLDGDGAVNGADLGLLLAAWGSGDPDADLNGDGVVDGADLGILLASWTG
jgi:hypothetical protein